jgi:hypothetical protein
MYFTQMISQWNALADVLGAYVEKKSIDGAMKYADEFGKQVDDLQKQKMKMNQVQTEQGADVKADAMERMRRSGVMPDTDWLHQNGPKPLKYGLDAAFERVSAPQTAAPLAGNTPAQPAAENAFQFKAPSLMEAAGMYQPKSNPLGVDTSFPIQSNKLAVATTTTPTTSTTPSAALATPVQTAKPYDPEFAARQKAHPEWFVGNTYVGNDDAARKNAYLAAGQQKVDAYKQQQNAPYTGSTLNMMQEFARRNSQAPQSSEAYANKSMDQFQFQKNQKEHPEWFVGDRYVGDKLTGDKAKDDKVRQDAALLNQQTAQEKAQLVGPGQSYKLKSGMEKYGATGELEKPLSYDEYTQKLKDMKIHAMRELVGKYGVEAAGKVEKMIDDTINTKVGSYGDQLLAGQMGNINRVLVQQDANGNYTRANMAQPANKAAFLSAVQNYNIAAQRMGKPQYDTQVMAKMMTIDDVKNVSIDSGGAINIVSMSPDGTTKTQQVIPKTLSAKDKLNHDDKVADRKLKASIADNSNRTKLQVANINGQYGLQKANISAASRGASRGRSSSEHAQRKWRDTLSTLGEAAAFAKNSGAMENDPDNHSVEEYRQAGMKALQSGDLDDEDKAAVIDTMKDLGVW